MAFGGPQGPADIRPFLANVLRGRRVAPERSRKSRITTSSSAASRRSPQLTLKQAEACARGCSAPARRCRCTSACATGIRTSRDTLAQMSRERRPARDRLHRRRAPELFELHAVPRERRRGAGRAAPRRACRRRGHLRRPTGTRIRGSSTPTPITSSRRAGSCRPPLRDRARDRVHRAQHPGVDGRALSVSAAVRGDAATVMERLRARRPKPRARTPDARRSIRAAADGPRIRGSVRTSATTCAMSVARARGGGALPRSASSAITSRCSTTSTSRRRGVCREIGLPMARPRGQRSSPLSRHDGGRRARVRKRYAHARPLELVREA